MERKSDTVIFQTPIKTPKKRLTEFNTPDFFSNVSLNSPLVPNSVVKGDKCSLNVAVRVRPFNTRELSNKENHCVIAMNDNETIVNFDKNDRQTYNFDFSFWSFDQLSTKYASQKFVYEKIGRPLLDQVLLGYNSCLFAYGQTSSGKSYCMIGDHQNEGIIPQFCKDLFDQIDYIKKDINITISFFEIYNEKIHDLLKRTTNEASKKSKLRIREDPINGPYVVELTSFPVQSFEEIYSWIDIGNKKRATAATEYNQQSSRSHSIFIITVTQLEVTKTNGETFTNKIVSKMNLVDLAGSEKLQSFNFTEDRLRETKNINKSLLTLGKVISTLSLSGKRNFVPYRESVLTWLLKESLGGNSKTSMLATISPSSICVDETLHTLRYAMQAKSILNSARINENPTVKIIKDLKVEIEELKKIQILNYNNENVQILLNQLSQKEKEIERLKSLWQQELELAKQDIEESKLLAEKNKDVNSESQTELYYSCLINLNMDPQISELLIYPIKPGYTYVGSKNNLSEVQKFKDSNEINCHEPLQIIHLEGLKIAQEHCCFHYDVKLKSVKLIGKKDEETFINGNLVVDEVILQHNDRIIFGQTHFFRFCDQANDQDTMHGKMRIFPSKSIYDYQFSFNELNNAINKKIEMSLKEQRVELDKAVAELKSKKDFLEKKAKSEIKILEANLQAEKLKMQMSIETSFKNKQIVSEQSDKMRLFLKECETNLASEFNDILSTKPAPSKLLNYLKDKKKDILKKYGNSSPLTNFYYNDICDLNAICIDNSLKYEFSIMNDFLKVTKLNSEENIIFEKSLLELIQDILKKDKDSINDYFSKLFKPIDLKLNTNFDNKKAFETIISKISIRNQDFDTTYSFADKLIKSLTTIMYFTNESFNDIFEEENSNNEKLYSLSFNYELLRNSLEIFISLPKNSHLYKFFNILEVTKSLQYNVQGYFKCCGDQEKLKAYEFVTDIMEDIFSLSQWTGCLAISYNMCIHELPNEIDDMQFTLLDSNIKVQFLKGCDLYIDDNLTSLIKTLEENDSKLLKDTNDFNKLLKKRKSDFLIQTRKVVYSSIILLRKIQAIKNEMILNFDKPVESICLLNSFILHYQHSLLIVQQYNKIYSSIIKFMENVKDSINDTEEILDMHISLIRSNLDEISSQVSSILQPENFSSNHLFNIEEYFNEFQMELFETAVAELQDATLNMSSYIDS